MSRARIFLVTCLLAAAVWLGAEALLLFVPVALLPTVFVSAPVCTIFTDDFSTDRTGTDYTTVSGTFSVGSGVITTTSAGALIVENTAGSTGHGRVTITGKASTSGGSFRVVGSYVDSSNYLFGELEINGASSTWKLWKRVAGANTQLGATNTFTTSTGTNYTVCISWTGAYASGTATIGSTSYTSSDAYTGTGNQAGFGATPGGTVTFDDFTFAKHNNDDASCAECGSIPCSLYGCFPDCVSSQMPGEFQVVISGVTDTGCGSCASFNGTFVISCGAACYYEYTLPSSVCGLTKLSIFIVTGTMLVTFIPNSGLNKMQWSYSIVGQNCFTNGVSATPGANTTSCDHTSSTCIITAI